jgi:hypothetical protein
MASPGVNMGSRNARREDNGHARFRITIVEGEGNTVGLQQIAQTIANANRTFIQYAPPPLSLPAVAWNGSQQGSAADSQPVIDLADQVISARTPPKKAPSIAAKRRSPTPNVIDLDLVHGKLPFVAYYHQKNPGTNHSKRYLVIAAWLKEYRQLTEITDDHVYTCYRMLNLNTVDDVGSVFRNCKKRGWFYTGSKRGAFAITHVGLNQVNDLDKGE